MIPAYSELYLSDAALALGSMLESAVYLFEVDLEVFWRLFLASHVSDDFGNGLSGTVSGKSGWELAAGILDEAGVAFPHGKPKGTVGRSREFWAGWALARYQWKTGLPFREIETFAPLATVLLMYSPYHEMSDEQIFDALDRHRSQHRFSDGIRSARSKILTAKPKIAHDVAQSCKRVRQP